VKGPPRSRFNRDSVQFRHAGGRPLTAKEIADFRRGVAAACERVRPNGVTLPDLYLVKGFTLLELLVALSIAAILATLALRGFTPHARPSPYAAAVEPTFCCVQAPPPPPPPPPSWCTNNYNGTYTCTWHTPGPVGCTVTLISQQGSAYPPLVPGGMPSGSANTGAMSPGGNPWTATLDCGGPEAGYPPLQLYF
jgi:prepilin-type N-terminal cleavage/methylation domain-containing protein